MSTPLQKIVLPTRRLDPAVVEVLQALKPGDRLSVTQTVRVGSRTWPAKSGGTFRGISYLSTGVTTERGADDTVVVPIVHFTKENGELATISLDENTQIARGH